MGRRYIGWASVAATLRASRGRSTSASVAANAPASVAADLRPPAGLGTTGVCAARFSSVPGGVGVDTQTHRSVCVCVCACLCVCVLRAGGASVARSHDSDPNDGFGRGEPCVGEKRALGVRSGSRGRGDMPGRRSSMCRRSFCPQPFRGPWSSPSLGPRAGPLVVGATPADRQQYRRIGGLPHAALAGTPPNRRCSGRLSERKEIFTRKDY